MLVIVGVDIAKSLLSYLAPTAAALVFYKAVWDPRVPSPVVS